MSGLIDARYLGLVRVKPPRRTARRQQWCSLLTRYSPFEEVEVFAGPPATVLPDLPEYRARH